MVLTIDYRSILSNKTVMNCIPTYVANLDLPTHYHKYNKPARGHFFNTKKLCVDLTIFNNTPETLACASSKCCFSLAGHVITGNFDTLKDK